MHKHTHMHGWLCICSPCICKYSNMVFQTHTSHRPCYITLHRLKSVRENISGVCFSFSLCSLILFQSLLVPEPISASFFLRGFRWAEINGRVAENLITEHYEAVMLLWLFCNVTFAGIYNNSGAEGHHVKACSARCNQSHASSWYKNKQLDFQSIIWDDFFLFVLECACEIRDKVVRSLISYVYVHFVQFHLLPVILYAEP